jgi:hypothetical protein
MLQNIPQSDGISPRLGAADRPGVVRRLPELRFPGRRGWFMEVYASDRPDPAPQPVELTDQAARRLALAVIARALMDARLQNKGSFYDREHARIWLLSDGAAWFAALGRAVTRKDLALWIECNCPDWGSEKKVG